ncbi:MAG: Holliday junction resolvase RuvX [Phycisphaerae bacterium]
MARWLAIDPGTRRLGVAVGETDGMALPVTVVSAQPRHVAMERLGDVIDEYAPEGIVVGWPLNMDDSEGPQARHARQLAQEVADHTGLDVRLWDERLSSFAADAALAGQFTRKKRRARQDAVAAAEILGDFLAGDGPATAPTPAMAVPPADQKED